MARPPDTTRESEVFETATRVFRAKGYHGTSMRDIADALGIQKPSLYHYISGKQDLLFRIFERGTGALTDQLDEIVRSDASATVKLERAIESHLTALCDQLEFFTVYLREQKFFSGKQMLLDTAGRVEKFNRRYGAMSKQKEAQAKPAEETAAP